jgi:hypothetical protein
MTKMVKEYVHEKENNSNTTMYFGKLRYPSKVEYYKQISSKTEKDAVVKKYQKKNILRAKSIKVPRQNLLVMKWDPPIKLTFD